MKFYLISTNAKVESPPDLQEDCLKNRMRDMKNQIYQGNLGYILIISCFKNAAIFDLLIRQCFLVTT